MVSFFIRITEQKLFGPNKNCINRFRNKFLRNYQEAQLLIKFNFQLGYQAEIRLVLLPNLCKYLFCLKYFCKKATRIIAIAIELCYRNGNMNPLILEPRES